jgi:hypothetical protein
MVPPKQVVTNSTHYNSIKQKNPHFFQANIQMDKTLKKAVIREGENCNITTFRILLSKINLRNT